MMNRIKKALAFLTLAFALMMLTVVILEQYNPTMGFFTGTTFRVYQPVFCVLSALVSALLLAGTAPVQDEAPARRERISPAPRRGHKPAPARPRREPAFEDRAEEALPEEYGNEYDDAYGGEAGEVLPDDFDWDDYLK